MKHDVVQAELLEWLRTYDGPRFQAVLSDPPYALISITKRFGKDGSAPAQEGSDGRFSRLSGGFMGQKWDGFESLEHYQDWVSEWAKLLIEKVLYPGAVCLFFGGTRTFHRLGVGLERGGFEIVDCLMWLHGQGFPKSHDISKGMDKNAGRLNHSVVALKRELIKRFDACGKTRKQIDEECGFRATNYLTLPAKDKRPDPWVNVLPSRKKWHVIKSVIGCDDELDDWLDDIFSEAEREVVGQKTKARSVGAKTPLPTTGGEVKYETFEVTVAGSEVSQTWDGYGTALKPAWEPIFLCRAPRGDKTFAQLAVEFGTGALNIDGSRIAGIKGAGVWGTSNEGIDTSRKFNASPGMLDYRSERHDSGRWPANFTLSHDEDCVKVGEFEVEGRTINRFTQGMMPFGGAEGEEYESEQMPPETVERWACVPSCPVRMLDDQAGEAGGGIATRGASTRIYGGGKGFTEATGEKVGFGDTGGPSRFFYTAKASRSEKDLGLEGFWWKRTGEGFERVGEAEYRKLSRRDRAQGCIHPTVKPLELCRYLATLVLPPERESEPRRIFIPFAGSGSEMIGAAQAGWDQVVGIEMEDHYIAIAEARLIGNLGLFA